MTPPHPFWREEPLNEHEAKLLALTFAAHAQCARRTNLSTAFILTGVRTGHSLQATIAIALQSLGGTHGPILQSYELIHGNWKQRLNNLLAKKEKVPGWGSSFVKGEPDPIFNDLRAFLMEQFPDELDRIDRITAALKQHGLNVEPNASAYTAAVAATLKMPKEIAVWLFIAGRLDVWSELFLKNK